MSSQTEDRPSYGPGRPKKGEDRSARNAPGAKLKLVSMTDLRSGAVDARVDKNTMVAHHWRVRINPSRELIRLADAMGMAESIVVGLAIHQMAVSKGLDIAPEPPAARPVWIHANVVPLEEVQKHYPARGEEPGAVVSPVGPAPDYSRQERGYFPRVDPMNDPPRFADTDPSYSGAEVMPPSSSSSREKRTCKTCAGYLNPRWDCLECAGTGRDGHLLHPTDDTHAEAVDALGETPAAPEAAPLLDLLRD